MPTPMNQHPIAQPSEVTMISTQVESTLTTTKTDESESHLSPNDNKAPSNTVVSAPTTTSNTTQQQQQYNDQNWKCHNCQNILPNHKKRCGKCHRWKNGTRGKQVRKKTKATKKKKQHQSKKTSTGNYPYDTSKKWTCENCNIVLPGRQTRCGKCMKWREGKRQGGWKLKSRKVKSIDQTVDWTCCGKVLPAKQTRCGKCHGWRGGTRVFRGVNTSTSTTTRAEIEQQVVESGEQQAAPSPSMRSVVDGARSLTNLLGHHRPAANFVFDYPMHMSYSMIAPVQPHPMLSSGYHPLPSPIVSRNRRNDDVAQSTEV